nr:amidase family protein [Mangrovicoccus ximenensis]
MAEAGAAAARWKAGTPLGPLDGLPVIIKDNLVSAGLPAAWGNAELARRVPDHDELPVAALRRAGAIVTGKGNTPEFAVEGYTDNLTFGVTRNPYDPALTPGGSSGGVVAAVATGKQAFDAACAECHGENAAGRQGSGPPLVHVIYEPGHHADPAQPGVTRADVAAITAYVRELQRANGID